MDLATQQAFCTGLIFFFLFMIVAIGIGMAMNGKGSLNSEG